MTSRCNEQLTSKPCSSCRMTTWPWWPPAAHLPPGSPGKPLSLTLVLRTGLVENFMQTWNLACLSFCGCLTALHEAPSRLLCYVSDGRICFEKSDHCSVYMACVHTPRFIRSSAMNGYEDHLHVMAIEDRTATSMDHLSLRFWFQLIFFFLHKCLELDWLNPIVFPCLNFGRASHCPTRGCSILHSHRKWAWPKFFHIPDNTSRLFFFFWK